MIYANCEIYENENGELGVLIRNENVCGRDAYWQDSDPNDYTINLDKRIIEYHLSNPNRHTYNDWLCFFEDEDFEVPSSFLNEIEQLEFEGDYNGAINQVTGFKLEFVPPDKLWRIESIPCFDDYHELIGFDQHVAIYGEEDFMHT